mgnify:CR=1 FL=1
MRHILELEQLQKTYQPGLLRKPVIALRGLDLSVRQGEVYGFLGANGAGKTTTFKLLLGLLRPTGGRGHLLGLPLGDRHARRRLGFLPELPAYYPHLTPRELLRFARALSGLKADDASDLRLLEELGLGALGDRSLNRMSKGQVQRLGLAQALVHEPELLILDEPMSGLDPLARAVVKDRIRRERARGCTVILSTHVLADVEVLCDTVGLLRDGQLALEGAPSELLRTAVREVVIEVTGAVHAGVLAGMPEGSTLVNVTEDGEEWQVKLTRPEPFQVDGCLRRLLTGGAVVTGVETRRQDLEDLFLRVTTGPGVDGRAQS